MSAPAERVWSPLQEAIFSHVSNPAGGNLVVSALAGTGKSTTIEEAVMRIEPQASVLVVAFNKSIAEAMKQRLDDPGITVCTLHSFGMRILREAGCRIDVDGRQAGSLLQRSLGPGSRKEKAYILKLLGLAKGSLAEGRELGALADSFELFAPKGPMRPKQLLEITASLLKQQAQPRRTKIDFDDMIWLPEVWGLASPQFDYVVVDELQDLNAAQLELCMNAVKTGGRFIGVGDSNQSIYQFRGADSQSMRKAQERTQAQLLPLSITYRCSQAVVREANRFVPELQAAPGAQEGVVRIADDSELFECAEPGDFVLARLNAPLVKLAYKWLRAGVACEIKGRNIGADLISFIEGLKARTCDELKALVGRWLESQHKDSEKTQRALASADDRAQCVLALASECASVAEITEKIEEMFADSASGDSSSLITLSSTHKAKGLEAERVWLLSNTYRPQEGGEEMNLTYVACTRAKRELVLVGGALGEAEAAE